MKNITESDGTDIILGEALMALLEEDAPVTYSTLLKKLQQMLSLENMPDRAAQILCALNEVRNAGEAPACGRGSLLAKRILH